MRRMLIVASLFLPAAAHAAGFAVAEQSAVAGGTAGAGTARADDPSAAWYNPAALADGAGWRAGLGVMAASPSLTMRMTDGSGEETTESQLLTPPNVSLSWASGERAYGVAVGVPFGAGVTWPTDWVDRYEIVSTRLEVVRVAPFIAWRFGKLSLAVGPHIDFGRLRLTRQLDFVDTEGRVAIDMWGVGLGIDASLAYELSRTVRLGVSYKSRTAISLDGDADFDDHPEAFSEKIPDQGVGADVTLPDRLAFGVSWRVVPRVTLLADLEVTVWDSWDRLVIDFEEEQTPDVTQVTDWHTTVAARAGAEWTATRMLTARGGLFIDPSPAPAETLAPTSPDSTRVGLTVGAGLAISKSLAVDAFYEYMQLLGQESENEDSLAAAYDGHAHFFGLGVRWTR